VAWLLAVIKKLKKIMKSLLKNLLNSDEVAIRGDDVVKKAESEPINEEPASRTIKVAIMSDESSKVKLEDLESLLQELLVSGSIGKMVPKTPYILNSAGAEWFYDPVNKQMLKVHAGTELILSDDTPDSDGKIMCYCDHGFILVPFEQISPLGYN